MKCLEEANLWRQRLDSWLPGMGSDYSWAQRSF